MPPRLKWWEVDPFIHIYISLTHFHISDIWAYILFVLVWSYSSWKKVLRNSIKREVQWISNRGNSFLWRMKRNNFFSLTQSQICYLSCIRWPFPSPFYFVLVTLKSRNVYTRILNMQLHQGFYCKKNGNQVEKSSYFVFASRSIHFRSNMQSPAWFNELAASFANGESW